MALKLIVKLWALATVRGLLPVIVPLNDDANGTQWGPVTADMPRTVNGTGHTGPSEFCATGI